MSPDLLIDLLARSSLLIGAAWLAAAWLDRSGASAAARHMVWSFAIAAVLLLPGAAAWLPPLPLPLPILPAAAPVPAVAVDAAAEANVDGWEAAFALYLAVAALLAGRLALGRYALGRLWRRSAPADDWSPLLRQCRAALGVSTPVSLRLSGASVMPMTWGVLRPRILLPAEARDWPEARRRIVLLHELAHVARRDALVQLAASCACLLYWFHPGVWFAGCRLRIEQEHACDDLVLAAGAPARAYARDLIDVAFALRTPRLAASGSLAMARASALERRILAILRPGSRRRPGRAFAAASGLGALVLTMLVAAAMPVRAVTARPSA